MGHAGQRATFRNVPGPATGQNYPELLVNVLLAKANARTTHPVTPNTGKIFVSKQENI
jgi:hypothetical protein